MWFCPGDEEQEDDGWVYEPEEEDDEHVVPYDARDPSIPYPIRADKDHWYALGCVGEKYSAELLSICGNSKFWEGKYRRMQSNMAAGADLVKCSRFQKVITHERSNPTMLRGVCNIGYLMQCRGEHAWELPDNVPQSEFKEYWDDVWRWCSISGSVVDKPSDWAVREEQKETPKTEDKKE